MNCIVCGAHVPSGERACLVCGASVRLPVLRERAAVPTLWRQAAPIVARGAALVALGVLSEWLVRSAAKRALALPFGGKRRKHSALARRQRSPAGDVVAVTETIIARRVVYRS